MIALHEARVGRIEHRDDVLGAARRAHATGDRARARDAGEPPAGFSWLALGSQSRREATPGSDVDSAIVWYGDVPEEAIRPCLHALATTVAAGLRECGIRIDSHGATASEVLFVRSIESWQRVARSWIEQPTQEQALILVSVLVDSRPVWGIHRGTAAVGHVPLGRARPELLRLLARFALSHRPPTGFLRGLVVEHDGEHRGRLDIKNGGLLPVVDLARWAGMAAGVTSASTTERLRAARDAGTLPAADVRTLEDALRAVHRAAPGASGRAAPRRPSPTTTWTRAS